MSVPSVPAERALAHVDALIEKCPGLTQTHFARLAGLAHNGLTVARRAGRITEETEERILAVSERHYLLSPPPQMPTTIVRDHVVVLLDQTGAYRNTVARAANVNYQTVYNVLGLKWPSVKWRIYASLMALTADDLIAEHYWVDRRPTTTRLRALQANQWSLSALGRSLDMNLSTLVHADPESPMHAPVERRIKAVYEAIGDTPGDSPRSATIARGLGFYPPIYYDEDMNLIEAPEDDEAQHEARTDLCILGQTIENRSVAQIAAALGVNERRVSRVRRLAGVGIERALDGGYEAVERREGAFAAIRAVVRLIHYRTTIDALDEPGLDYVALLCALYSTEDTAAAA